MRTGAVDYGRRRIGLAVCDPLGIAVRGLDTLRRDDDAAAAARAVAEALKAEGVEHVILGLPLHTDGRESPMSGEVRAFATLLQDALGMPVELVDEGLTTWEAEEAIKARGMRLREAKKKGLLDREAACALLRAWLREGQQPGSEGA